MLSRNLNICGGYDPLFSHHLILGRNSNICGRYDLFLPGARNFSQRPWAGPISAALAPGQHSFDETTQRRRAVGAKIYSSMILQNARATISFLTNAYVLAGNLCVQQRQRKLRNDCHRNTHFAQSKSFGGPSGFFEKVLVRDFPVHMSNFRGFRHAVFGSGFCIIINFLMS